MCASSLGSRAPDLSDRRAAAVKQYLVDKGVEDKRLTSQAARQPTVGAHSHQLCVPFCAPSMGIHREEKVLS